MSRRDSRRKPKQTGPGRRTRRSPTQRTPQEPDLIAQVAAALDDDDPLALLDLASMMVEVLDPPPQPFAAAAPTGLPPRDELLQSFFDVEMIETSAVLTAVGALSGDDVLRRRVRREVVHRAHALPGWLAELDRATLAPRTVEVVHVLGDGDNVLVGVRLAGGHELTAVVYIDHNMGTVVKDAFVVPEALDALLERMIMVADDPDTAVRDLDPADARARITEAIAHGARMFPPPSSKSWPQTRPLVRWIAGMLPEGGQGYVAPEWTRTQRHRLAKRITASPFGAGLDDPDRASLLDDLLWFGTDFGPGDPLRWSPVAVEIVLVDWIPRKIVADVPLLAKAPDTLRALIRFSHDERGIRPELTAETLAAVDGYEPEYQRLIRSPRPQGVAALLASVGVPVEDDEWDGEPWGGEPDDYRDVLLDVLRRAVGGEAALDALDADPLPDEPFAWEGVAADVHDRVDEVLALVDGCCDALFDTEFRTACRRFLADAAAADPAMFRRRGKPATAAAAVCWVIGRANVMFDGRTVGSRVKDLTAHLGVSQGGLSPRSEPLLRAVGVNPHEQYGEMNLASPRYLVGERRAGILELRDRYRAADPAD